MSMDVLSKTTYQLPKFWLKDSALRNMLRMVVTSDTFQPEMSPLKEVAPKNILDTSVTPETSQPMRCRR